MDFLRFRLHLIGRCLLLVGLTFLLFRLLLETRLYVTAFLLILLILALILNLLSYAEQTTREVARFIMAIRNSEFSQSFKGRQQSGAFKELARGLDDILDTFRQTRFEKEAQAHYLDVVVQHVGVALIAFQADGEISLFNHAAGRLFGVKTLRNLRDLRGLHAGIDRKLMALVPRKRELITTYRNDEILHLSMEAAENTQRSISHKLVSIQNIQGELEEKELQAWQQLIQVLTHEINNSITPITLLAETAHRLFRQDFLPKPGDLLSDAGEDILEALAVTEKRSQGLLRFVENYRSLSNIPTPKPIAFPVQDLFANLTVLLGHQLEKSGVVLMTQVYPNELILNADFDLVEQVLINLIKNAEHALVNVSNPLIVLHAAREYGRTIVRVTDNGKGIVQEALDKIFIPFFKTSREGSGIGLSLARVIMRRHGGSIRVSSSPGQSTVFTLRF